MDEPGITSLKKEFNIDQPSITSFKKESDICLQLLDRYGNSVAPHHRKLCKTAQAIRTIIATYEHPPIIKAESEPSPTSSAESEPPHYTAMSYLDTIIDTFKKTTAHNAEVLSAFLAIVLPVVTHESIPMSIAAEAAKIVVKGLEVQASSAMTLSLVKSLGLLLRLSRFQDWESAQSGFKMLINHSLDKRIKVRECVHDCVGDVLASFGPDVKISASQLVLDEYMSLAVGSASAVGDEASKTLEEAANMLQVLKILLHIIPDEVTTAAIAKLQDWSSPNHSPLMRRHLLDVMEAILAYFESEADHTYLNSVYIEDKWHSDYAIVISSIAGVLSYEEANATRASNILQERAARLSICEDVCGDDSKDIDPQRFIIVESFCDALENVLNTLPNEHALDMISNLFQNLGIDSRIHMNRILVKLGGYMTSASGHTKRRLVECIGCGVYCMGPEGVHEFLPITFDARNLIFSNDWLIPVYKEYAIDSSLSFFIDTIVPLAKSLQEACLKDKKRTDLRQDLESLARGCWELLPSFCRHPCDIYEKFASLAEILIPYIKEEDKDAPFMLENITTALQHLIKQNKNIKYLDEDEASKLPHYSYNKKTATRNIEALSSYAEQFLRAFIIVFFQVSPRKRALIKNTIRCLALIMESSAMEAIFISSLKLDISLDNYVKNRNALILELASSFVDPANLVYNFINECLKEKDGKIQREAYATLNKVLVESYKFRSLKFLDLFYLLPRLESPVDTSSLKSRILCFKSLLLHSLEMTCEGGQNTFGTLMLTEIINSKGESRAMAYKILLEISSSLQEISSSSNTGPYYEFISMIMQDLSGSWRRKRGAVCVLSVLIYNDSKLCHLKPDLVPAILDLLDTEHNMQVIQAAFGFVEVLVRSLQVGGLYKLLSDILVVLVPWLFDPPHPFTSKVNFLLEIMSLKCGYASVVSLVPKKHQDYVINVLKHGPSTAGEEVTITSTNHLMHLLPEEKEEEEVKVNEQEVKVEEGPMDVENT